MATKTATAKIGGKVGKKVEKEEPADAAPATKRVGASKWKPEHVITLLVDYNPKRPSGESHARFELYEDGMTVEDALEAGLTSGDLNWDVSHELIKIEDELDEDVEKKSKPVTKAKKEAVDDDDDDDADVEEAPKAKAKPKGKGKAKAKAKVDDEEDEDC